MPQPSTGPWERAQRVFAHQQRALLLRYLTRPSTRARLMPQVGDTVGGFTLEQLLGSGSFGTVFLARRREDLYAFKLFYLPQAGAWAWRELEIVLRLHHVGLVGVESHGHHGQWPGFGSLFLYIVTGYVPGTPLNEWVEQTHPSAWRVVNVMVRLAEQLALAHSMGVVHRDLKGDNVVVREPDGEPVLLDFGVGTFPGAVPVTEGSPPGNGATRAPEVWRFQRERKPHERYEARPQDDLWALGALFYWILVGRWPFEGDTPEQLEDAVLHGALVAPRERNARVPPALEAVCLRMLEKRPEERYATAQAVIQALTAAMKHADNSWRVPLSEGWQSLGPPTRLEGPLELDSWHSIARAMRLAGYRRRHFVLPGQRLANAEGARAPGVISRVRAWRARTWLAVLVGLGLLCAGLGLGLLSTHPGTGTPRPSALPAPWATPASEAMWLMSEQRAAPTWCPLEGGDGAAPSWVTIPAPVAFATHSKDGSRVKTLRDPVVVPPLQSRGIRRSVTRAACALAVGALATGCSGLPVRADPRPEPCPEGSEQTMREWLDLFARDRDRTTLWALERFPTDALEAATVREGSWVGFQLKLTGTRIKEDTVLWGRVYFGKERVFIRFTQAPGPQGMPLPICLEAQLYPRGTAHGGRAVPVTDLPDTRTINAAIDAYAVKHFE